MSVEGIFRKNGNIRRIKEYAESLDRDPSSVDLSLENPVQLAALLKKFLRELPDPLMTFKLHRLFVATQCLSLSYYFNKHDTNSRIYSHTLRRGTQADVAYDMYHHAEKPSRYHGSALRVPEMGSLFRSYG